MAVIGQARSYFKKFKFIVEIDSITYAGFQKASSLEGEVAKVEHWEGGSLIPNKSPGRVTFTDVTLERGATNDNELKEWWEQVIKASANSGLSDVDARYKRNADIVQQDRDGTTLKRWRLDNAFPAKFVYGEWDNDADENVIEMITLTFDYPYEVGAGG